MTARPAKRSLTLAGHRTSVSLEAEFWSEFRRLADQQKRTVNALASDIDAQRGDIGLASAIRVYVLRQALAQSQPPSPDHDSGQKRAID